VCIHDIDFRSTWIVILQRGRLGGGVVLGGFVAFLLDQVFPERCIICGSPTAPPSPIPSLALPPRWPGGALGFFGTDFSVRLFPGIRVTARVLCTECWLRMEPARQEACLNRTGGCEREDDLACSRTERDNGHSVPLIAPFLTNDSLLEVVRYLKFSGGIRAAPPLSWWMAFALRRYLSSVREAGRNDTIVTAVPLHPARMRRRGYNQAALLGAHVARRLGLAFNEHLIVRTRNTPYQSHLPEERRAMNVRDAFKLCRGASIGGTRIVLVDDLVTTGETVASCARELVGGGPASVAVLAAGRVAGVGPGGGIESGTKRLVP
jgi:ComF family protein